MIVMKFGGTSLADGQRLAAAARIVAQQSEPPVVVVSAMGHTTDALLAAGESAERGDLAAARATVAELAVAHRSAARDEGAEEIVEPLIAELDRVLEGISLLGEQSPRSRALLASFGERLSAPLLAQHLADAGIDAEPVDARSLVVTDERHLGATVRLAETRERVSASLPAMLVRKVVPVVTGFLGATRDGVTTTLGRGGSDYTATLLGALLAADEVWIWTDVSGVLTADPRLVKEVRALAQISYREAAEMAYFGADVLHPQTIGPAVRAGIPVRVRNSFAPEHPGTLIAAEAPPLPGGVKIVTSIRDLALVTLEGRGMIGVPGVARRIFEASEAAGTNVIMISQASSEQAVSLVVRAAEAGGLIEALRQRFAVELAAAAIDSIGARRGVAVASIIGEGMAGRPGIAAKLFGALAAVKVNVLAIAQGASELSISVAIADADAARAVRAAHMTFGLNRVSHVVVLGCGNVGSALLRLLGETHGALAAQLGVELRLVGLADSRRLLLEPDGLDPATAREALADAPPRAADRELIALLQGQHFTEVIVVDTTAADLFPLHADALASGLHVVTANKKPLSGALAQHRALDEARAHSGARYLYETTVGAALPVLDVLRALVNTGDALIGISACLSGTLGFICSQLQDGVPLDAAVAAAAAQGLTEPDPREDLSGQDVLRKALIIARAAGISVEPHDVAHEPFVYGLEEGLERALLRAAERLLPQLRAAAARDEVLRYVAEISRERVRVGPVWVPARSPLGALRGPDNILVFRTRRYDAHPLVIQGPGAGAEVTAAGLLGDVLKVATR